MLWRSKMLVNEQEDLGRKNKLLALLRWVVLWRAIIWAILICTKISSPSTSKMGVKTVQTPTTYLYNNRLASLKPTRIL